MHPLFAVFSMPLDPIIVRLGGLAIHWYGLFIALGILVNVPLARRECKRKGISEDLVFNLAVWCVIFGVIGGRLYYVIQADQPGGFAYYIDHPGEILATWEGGMAFYGMVFAVFLTVLGYCYWSRKGQRLFWALLDMVAVFLPLGQTFGRLGNVVNGDIVGYPSNLPWAIRYPNPNALAPDHVTAFQPASLYELLFSLALFGFLWWMRTRVKVPGLLFAMYTFLYSAGQFGIFYLRDNPITVFDLKQAQVTALAVMVATLPLAAYLLRRYESHGGDAALVEAPADAEVPLAPAVAAAEAPAPAPAARVRRPRAPKEAAPAPVVEPEAETPSEEVKPAPRRRSKPGTAPIG
ncbi:MAG TPA: prolipoprotein diacylglyceryl transferase [Chloroflexota bacterium]|nr:prolipoprotein diacylglyceryl transferase [Chloroflexota bacterium]